MTTVVPIQCIIPPHMLRAIIEHGNPRQRTWATQTLSLSERLRGRREILSRLVLATSTGQKRRTVYDARNGFELPGVLIRTEGDPPSGDPAVDEAYDGAGATYDLYLDIFERNSLDDRGIRLDATVHYDRDYNNAFWDGRQMVYGDGDGQLFERFTRSIDVIAHELTHGVTQYEAGLVYSEQPGALNESFSDVFGSLVKQRVLNQTAAEADWLVGEGLFTANVQGVALRSVKAPGTAYDDPVLGKDPQPALLRDYQDVDYDNGGVHINSGIPNYAFYLTAVEIGGYAWEKAGRIWYIALKDKLRRDTDFERAATLILQVARELYGEDGPEYRAVRNSWETVGIVI